MTGMLNPRSLIKTALMVIIVMAIVNRIEPIREFVEDDSGFF